MTVFIPSLTSNRSKRYTENFKNTIAEIYNSGKTLSELNSEYGTSKSTIKLWIKKSAPIQIDKNKTITTAEYQTLIKKMAKLKEENEINISLKRTQRLMKKLGIKSVVCKKFRPFPSKSKVEEKENILKRDFNTSTINQKWCTDITYIHTIKDGWCYLASVMDL